MGRKEEVSVLSKPPGLLYLRAFIPSFLRTCRAVGFLELNRSNSQVLVGLLTDHCKLLQAVTLNGIYLDYDAECRVCMEEDEMVGVQI